MSRFYLYIIFTLAYQAIILGADQTLTSDGPLHFYQVQQASTPLVIDGHLDEFSWSTAVQINTFERILNDYARISQPTRAKMLWDKDYFYFSFICKDRDMWTLFDQEDDPLWSEEVVEIFIDPDGDGRAYLELEVSPTNTLVDLLIHTIDPTWESSKDWDIVGLKTAVQAYGSVNDSLQQDLGWTVEIAIPWPAIDDSSGVLGGGCPTVGDMWRLNLYRIERLAGRQSRQEINSLNAQLAPLQQQINSLLEDNDVDSVEDLPSTAQKVAANLNTQMEPLHAALRL